MSHFTLLVVGDNPEAQLEPFNENTPSEGRYKKVPEGSLERRQKYADEQGTTLEAELANFYGSIEKREDGWYYYTTYNENAKWDWYTLGGRWSGFFLLKEGARPNEPRYVDAALKGDIDFERMRRLARDKEAALWRKVLDETKDMPEPRSWSEILDKHGANTDRARNEYNFQPAVVALQHVLPVLAFGDPIEEFCLNKGGPTPDDLQQAMDTAAAEALTTFAVLKDGKWYERGEMGWWACVKDEKDGDEWTREFQQLLDSVPDDTLLSVYDCHI